MKKSLRDIAREIRADVIESTERAALKKARTDMVVLKVYRKDLEDYIDRGWIILSHSQSTFTNVESFLMTYNTEALRERLDRAAAV